MPPSRHDLAVLEFDAVRELLRARLTTSLGRYRIDEIGPLTCAAEANARAGEAEELAARLGAGEQAPTLGAVEVRSWLPRFWAGEHQPQARELAELKRLLRASHRCKTWLAARANQRALCALAATFPAVGDLVAELESIVDDRGEILDTASVKLAAARADIQVAEAAVRASVARFVADDEVRRCLQSIEPAWRNGRPVFGVRQEMRGRVAGVLHDRSQSGATLFIEPSVVVESANRLADARAAEHREIQVVLTHACRGLRRNQGDVDAAVDAMSRLDVAVACARLIAEDGWVRAQVVDAPAPLRLHGALHPILLQTAPRREDLVELDLVFGESFRMLVVTGPNTGGKTVVLKTIGLLSLMAMSGVPVPARAGTAVPFFDGVFADIGDAQGISQNLSTFSSHVTRIVRCLRDATRSSLVLLDELGAGTDPEEGGALGYAVLEEIERRGPLAAITTHVGRLKRFVYEHKAAENGAMAFDGASLCPLYRLDIGIPGTSHALDIAARVGLAQPVIERARAILGVRDQRLEEEIQRVQEARRHAEIERQRRMDLSREAEQAGQLLAGERQEVAQQRHWLQEEADALVEEQLRGARELLTPMLRELTNGPRGLAEKAEAALTAVDALLRQSSVHRRRMRFLAAVKRDGAVWLPRLGKRAIVHKIDRVRETVIVEVGKMRIEVPFEDVSWLQPLEP